MGTKTVSFRLKTDNEVEAWLIACLDGEDNKTAVIIEALSRYYDPEYAGQVLSTQLTAQPTESAAAPVENSEVAELLRAMIDEQKATRRDLIEEQRATRRAISKIRAVAGGDEDEPLEEVTAKKNGSKAAALFQFTASKSDEWT